jgi:hypothetical protein
MFSYSRPIQDAQDILQAKLRLPRLIRAPPLARWHYRGGGVTGDLHSSRGLLSRSRSPRRSMLPNEALDRRSAVAAGTRPFQQVT